MILFAKRKENVANRNINSKKSRTKYYIKLTTKDNMEREKSHNDYTIKQKQYRKLSKMETERVTGIGENKL